MARAPKQPELAPARALSLEEMRQGVERLNQRIQELSEFDVARTVAADENPPELTALVAAIERTLSRTFGENTADYKRYEQAIKIPAMFMAFGPNYPLRHHYAEQILKNIENSKHLLRDAVKGLEEELLSASLQLSKPKQQIGASKVFVVHGHDVAARESMARFLEKIDLGAIILHEQPDQGMTVIEKFESYANQVGFAVVLLTPDDVGGAVSASAEQQRARQNVIFELGYFAGKLGRGKACLLRKGNVEIPSDLAGIIYTEMDAAEAWKIKLVKELKAAGMKFDANKVWE